MVWCRTCDRKVMGSNPARGCCVPTPTQRAIPSGSVNEYQQKLGSKRGYHAMHWPCVYLWSCGFSWCPAEGYEMEISAAIWALVAWKRTLLYFTVHKAANETVLPNILVYLVNCLYLLNTV